MVSNGLTPAHQLPSDFLFYLMFQSYQAIIFPVIPFCFMIYTWDPIFLTSGLQCLSQYQIHERGVLNPDSENLWSPWNWYVMFCAFESVYVCQCVCVIFLQKGSIRFQILKVEYNTQNEGKHPWWRCWIKVCWIEWTKSIWMIIFFLKMTQLIICVWDRKTG